MAVLNDAQRSDAARRLIRNMFVEANATAMLDSLEVRQMIDAMDDYLEANLSPINLAFPAGVRAKASLSQKALALSFAAMKRGGVI